MSFIRLIDNVVYKAKVWKEIDNNDNYDNEKRIYIIATIRNWENKIPIRNLSFINKEYANSTTFSKYVCQIKNETSKSLMIK